MQCGLRREGKMRKRRNVFITQWYQLWGGKHLLGVSYPLREFLKVVITPPWCASGMICVSLNGRFSIPLKVLKIYKLGVSENRFPPLSSPFPFMFLLCFWMVLKSIPIFRNGCSVTFYTDPVGLSVFPHPLCSGRAACQAALGQKVFSAQQGGGKGGGGLGPGGVGHYYYYNAPKRRGTPCRLCLCYHFCFPHRSYCFF